MDRQDMKRLRQARAMVGRALEEGKFPTREDQAEMFLDAVMNLLIFDGRWLEAQLVNTRYSESNRHAVLAMLTPAERAPLEAKLAAKQA